DVFANVLALAFAPAPRDAHLVLRAAAGEPGIALLHAHQSGAIVLALQVTRCAAHGGGELSHAAGGEADGYGDPQNGSCSHNVSISVRSCRWRTRARPLPPVIG